MANPFVTSSMVWDPDINPEGVAEQFKHTFSFSVGGGSPSDAGGASLSKDGKTVVTPLLLRSRKRLRSISLSTLRNSFTTTLNPENPIGPSPSGLPENDSFLLGWQVGAKINFPHDFYFQLAPTLYNYTGTGDNLTGPFVGDPAFIDAEGDTVTTNQTGVNNLFVFDIPMEFGFKIGELPVRIFGEFARNFSGDTRAVAAGHPDKTSEVNAYQIGAGIGKLKEKHSWELRGFWQHAEQFSLDPNLVDSDIFDSRVNMQGFAVFFGYQITDAVLCQSAIRPWEPSRRHPGNGRRGRPWH